MARLSEPRGQKPAGAWACHRLRPPPFKVILTSFGCALVFFTPLRASASPGLLLGLRSASPWPPQPALQSLLLRWARAQALCGVAVPDPATSRQPQAFDHRASRLRFPSRQSPGKGGSLSRTRVRVAGPTGHSDEFCHFLSCPCPCRCPSPNPFRLDPCGGPSPCPVPFPFSTPCPCTCRPANAEDCPVPEVAPVGFDKRSAGRAALGPRAAQPAAARGLPGHARPL